MTLQQVDTAPNRSRHTSTRVMAILQLCLAFCLLMWVLAGPFMAEYFSYRSSLLLYEAVMGRDATKATNDKDLRNAERFAALPQHRRLRVARAYDNLEASGEKTFAAKSIEALEAIFVDLPMFTQAWMLLSIVIGILLLKRRDGARAAAWILPLLALAYSADNIYRGTRDAGAPDAALFPSEQHLVTQYLEEPLSKEVAQQRDQLMGAWHRYLVTEWAKEPIASNTEVFVAQVQRGEHSFHVARLEKRLDAQEQPGSHRFPRQSRSILFLYVLWNIFFAYMVNRRGA